MTGNLGENIEKVINQMTNDFAAEPGPDEQAGLVRQQSFDSTGPVELDLGVGAGHVEVRLTEEPGVHVEIRHDPSSASPWAMGISNLVNWFAEQFGDSAEEARRFEPAEAIRQTRIDLTGGRLVVHTPKHMQLRHVPLAVTVLAPTGSHPQIRCGSADVVVAGSAGRLNVHSGSGTINVDRADGVATVTSGSGAIRLGPMLGGLRARTGSGELEVSSLAGAGSSLGTGSGDVWLGAVAGDVMVRTGSGAVTVADAASGQIDLHTGSGKLRIGVRKGCPAEIDLSSGSGEVRSELDLAGSPPETKPELRVRGRTGSGSALVTTAME